jgi:hypothetical protein
MHQASRDETSAQRQSFHITTAVVRIGDSFDDAPGRVAHQRDCDRGEEDAAERGVEHRCHRAASIGRSAIPSAAESKRGTRGERTDCPVENGFRDETGSR